MTQDYKKIRLDPRVDEKILPYGYRNYISNKFIPINGLLWANIPKDLIQIIVRMAWDPKTHYQLAMVCKYFAEWVMDEKFLLSKYLSNTIDVTCLYQVRIIRKFCDKLGREKIMKIIKEIRKKSRLILGKHYNIAGDPLPKFYLLFCNISDISKNIGLNSFAYFSEYFDIRNTLPEDLYSPYPAWRLLSNYKDAWFSSMIIIDSGCPFIYFDGIKKNIDLLVNNPQLNNTLDEFDALMSKLSKIYILDKQNVLKIILFYVNDFYIDEYDNFISQIILDTEINEENLFDLVDDSQYYDYEIYEIICNKFVKRLINYYISHNNISTSALNWLNSRDQQTRKYKIAHEKAVDFLVTAISLENANNIGIHDTSLMILKKCNNLEELLYKIDIKPRKELIYYIINSKHWSNYTNTHVNKILQLLIKSKGDLDMVNEHFCLDNIFAKILPDPVDINSDKFISCNIVCYLIGKYPKFINLDNSYIINELDYGEYKSIDVMQNICYLCEKDENIISNFIPLYEELIKCFIDDYNHQDIMKKFIYFLINKTQVLFPINFKLKCQQCMSNYLDIIPENRWDVSVFFS